MNSHPDCYGRLFPPVETVVHGKEIAGGVFGYRIAQPGLVNGAHASLVDMRAWEECAGCRDFDTCYRLSTGKLLLEFATRA
jgi:hypothetical protein